ncbi:MAG: hypothetical protein FJ253_12300, partial [Phycisphaerae bacterium]|nr:hypothetical protein [Phycisphaerae bacterium]
MNPSARCTKRKNVRHSFRAVRLNLQRELWGAFEADLSPLRPVDPFGWIDGVFAPWERATSRLAAESPGALPPSILDSIDGAAHHAAVNRNTHSAAPVALLAFASSRAALVSILLSLISAAALAGPSPPRFRHDSDGAAPNGQSVVDAARSDFQRIAILPDRTTGMDWGLRYLTQAVADLNRLRPDAVFTIGDMVQGYHRDEAEWTRQATQYLEIVSPLVMPFFPVPGNHDVISGTRRDGDATFAELYRRAFGPLWYSVDLERLTVIVLFSDDGVGVRPQLIRDEQLAWLSGALDAASTRGKPIVVLMHRPLWRASVEHWNEKIRPLLEKASVRAVIAGHFHSMQRDETIGGIDYHILGTCGGSIDQHPYAGQMQHLTFLDVPAEGALRLFHMP